MIRDCCAAIALVALLAAPLQADEFQDFRIPEHRLFSWTGSANSAMYSSRGSGTGAVFTNSDKNAAGSTALLWFHDSDAAQGLLSVQASTDGGWRRSRNEYTTLYTDGPTYRYILGQRSTAAGESWSASVSQRNYPWRLPIGWQADLSGGGSYRQSWFHGTQDEYFADTTGVAHAHRGDHDVEWNYSYIAQGALRFGYGRVRDATGVFEARVFEQRLRGAGVLTRDLSPQARQQLAAVAYTVGDAAQVHDRPAKFLWRDVAEILRQDGALADSSLDAASAERVMEPFVGASRGQPSSPIAPSPVNRATGWFAGLTVTGNHYNNMRRATRGADYSLTLDDSTLFANANSRFYRDRRGQDELLLGWRVEYSRPLNWRWQLDTRNDVALPVRRHRDGLRVESQVFLSALLADRWVGEGYVQQQRVIDRVGGPGAPELEDSWEVLYGARLAWYLEDRLQFRGDIGEQQSRMHARGDSFQRALTARLGLSYRFAGWHSGPRI